jgi:hypothetical protein
MLGNDEECFLCRKTVALERHHIFSGAYRKRSEEKNMIVYLCHWCHNEPPMGVHHNHAMNLRLKRAAQYQYEKTHSREQFMGLFGRNYLEGT